MTTVTVGLLVLGMLTLIGGAELVVRGSSRLAAALGMSPLLIGLTLVAFGTSAPEVAVSVEASLAGSGAVALGNVAGSNIFNILVVLGISAIVAPLVVERQLVRMDVPIMIGVSLLPLALGANGLLGRGEGVALLVLGAGYTALLAWMAFRTGRDDGAGERPSDDAPAVAGSRALDVLMVLAGFGALLVGADWLITSSTSIARALGASELVIGLTLVAAATSLPELATSVMAAFRGERDLAVGNVVGSNIFNVLVVLGAASAVTPAGLEVPLGALSFDLPIVVMVAAACLPVFFTGWRISRWEGVVFVVYYGIYLAYLVLDAATHHAEDEFVHAVVIFVVPLTLVSLMAGWAWGRARSREA